MTDIEKKIEEILTKLSVTQSKLSMEQPSEERQEALHQALRDSRQAILKLIESEVREGKVEEIGKIPNEWAVLNGKVVKNSEQYKEARLEELSKKKGSV